jgi:hypothetical protein
MNLDKRIEEGIQKLLRWKEIIVKRGGDTKAIDKAIKSKRKRGRTRARKRAGGGNKPGSIPHGTEQALNPGTSRSGSWPPGANRPKGSTQWQRENSSTEYEGPSLSEKIEFIKTFLSESKKKKTPVKMGETPPEWPFPPTKEAVDRLKKMIADRKARQVESKQGDNPHTSPIPADFSYHWPVNKRHREKMAQEHGDGGGWGRVPKGGLKRTTPRTDPKPSLLDRIKARLTRKKK